MLLMLPNLGWHWVLPGVMSSVQNSLLTHQLNPINLMTMGLICPLMHGMSSSLCLLSPCDPYLQPSLLIKATAPRDISSPQGQEQQNSHPGPGWRRGCSQTGCLAASSPCVIDNPGHSAPRHNLLHDFVFI